MEMNLVKECSRRTRESVPSIFDWRFRFLDNDQRKTEWSSESSVGLFESDERPEEKWFDSSNIHVLSWRLGFNQSVFIMKVMMRLYRIASSAVTTVYRFFAGWTNTSIYKDEKRFARNEINQTIFITNLIWSILIKEVCYSTYQKWYAPFCRMV